MSFDWSSTSLPNPSIDYSAGTETSVIRTKMDSGRPRQRRRFTSGLRTITVVWKFTDAQYRLFQGVYLYKISSGADLFDNISLANGDSIESLDNVRFADNGYNARYVGFMEWRVSAKLEITDISPLSEAEVDAILPP